jgi:polysaccharide chain length determinant protein (PEP-CTERM system associated)
MKNMQLDNLVLVLRDMWNRRWVGLAIAWAVGVVGAAILYVTPERWEANARIYVDTQAIIKPLLQGLAEQPDMDQTVAMLARNLASRPNVERLVTSAGLDAGLSEDKRDQLIRSIMRAIKVNNVGGRVNLYDITYRDTDPERAKRVVAESVAQFVASEQGNKSQGTSEARKFIDEQIAQYETKLEESENRLKDFRLKHFAVAGGAVPGQDYIARMSATQQELAQVQIDLGAAEQSRNALRAQLAQEGQFLGSAQATRLADVDARIVAQQKQLDDLRRRFTDEHPDVIAAKRVIADLQAERRQIASAPVTPDTSASGLAENPVHQQIKIKLAEAEANVASLSGRAAELRARLQELTNSAAEVPRVEAELAQLNRDYDVMKKNYEQLVQRRESASISVDESKSVDLADFRVIEPPRVDQKPLFPSRSVLIFFMLLLALGGGAAACLALVNLFPTFQSVRDLRLHTTRASLGAISLQSDGEASAQGRRMNIVFYVAVGVLVVAYGAWSIFVGLNASTLVT